MDRPQKQFVVATTVVCTSAVNILFFRLDNGKELCEGARGFGANCTVDLMSRDLCTCIAFDCDSLGCNGCAACDTIANCYRSCRELEPPGLAVVLVGALVTTPLIFMVNYSFKWWHKPLLTAIHTLTMGRRLNERNSKEVIATKRSCCAASLPYTIAAAIALGSTFIIASISQGLSPEQTWYWVLSVAKSLAVRHVSIIFGVLMRKMVTVSLISAV